MRKPITGKEKELINGMESVVKEGIDKLDPIGLLAGGARKNEYAQEIREITLRLWMTNNSFLRLAEIMYVVFAFKFDLDDAKPEGKYFQCAAEIVLKYKEWKDGRIKKEISMDIH